VSSSGPARRETDTLWRVVNSSFASNTFIQSIGAGGECFVVDPGLDAPAIDAALTALQLRPRFVCCTHGHFDHAGSAAFLQQKYDAKVFLHAADQRTLNSSNFLLMALKVPQRIEIPNLDLVFDDGFVIPVEGEQVRYRATPGHTPGSCIIEFQNALFTGDTLFSRGVDSSRFPGANATDLRASLRRVWNLFPSDSLVYSGHGDSAAFGWIKANNAKLRQLVGISDESDDWTSP
jgi:hydroxyacylglutathione hydrolase